VEEEVEEMEVQEDEEFKQTMLDQRGGAKYLYTVSAC